MSFFSHRDICAISSHFATYRAIIVRYPMKKASTKEFCNTIATSIVRYEDYRCWPSKSVVPFLVPSFRCLESVVPFFVPSFRLGGRGNIRQNHPFGAEFCAWSVSPQGLMRSVVSQPIAQNDKEIEGLGCLLGICPELARNSLGKRLGPAMRGTLHPLETTLLRTPQPEGWKTRPGSFFAPICMGTRERMTWLFGGWGSWSWLDIWSPCGKLLAPGLTSSNVKVVMIPLPAICHITTRLRKHYLCFFSLFRNDSFSFTWK